MIRWTWMLGTALLCSLGAGVAWSQDSPTPSGTPAAAPSAIDTPAPAASPPEVGQLPHVARPLTYRIDLRPNLSHLTFAGNETIEVQVQSPTATLTLNALDLTVSHASLLGASPADGTVQTDKEHQTIILHFPQPLEPGQHTLSLDFKGHINQSTQGLFYLRYGAHREHILLATDLEPSDCRRIFPGWDEPAYRARFHLSITVPNGFMGVANMPVEKTENPAPGLHKLTFAMSPPMATYLFNFEAGDFETIGATAGGTPIRVVTTRGKARQGLYALQIASRILPWYNEYFGVRYPLPKLDLIALPKSTGAMENWGAITYDESALLFDPATSPPQVQGVIFNTVAHEMAHQWFGDLVTMTWWDNLWLNESFASWMALKATEHFNPRWQTWVDIAQEKNQSMQTDASHSTHPIQQPVHDPSEADSVFDDITYGKGSSVIRMLEGYLGPAAFQKGIQRYMQVHQYSNTTTTDLWQALGEASGQPVTDIARTWTETSGFPLVALEGSTDPQLMTQQRFFDMPPQPTSAPWKVPLTFVPLTADGTAPSPSLLEEPSVPLPRQGGPYKLNARGTGYYRVLYATADLDGILRGWDHLGPSDRLELLQDQWALVGARKAPPETWLRLIKHLRPTEDLYLYPTLLDQFEAIDRVLSGTAQHQWRKFALTVLHPVLAQVGWTIAADEPPVKMTLRARLLADTGCDGDAAVQREASRRFHSFLSDASTLPPSLRPAVLQIVAFEADERAFDTLHELAQKEPDFTQKKMMYQALSCVEDARLASRVLDLTLSNELPGDAAAGLVRRVALGHPDLAWHFALQHAHDLLGHLSVFERISYLPEVAELESETIHADELEAYAREHADSVSRIPMDKAVERIRFTERFKRSVVPDLLRSLRSLR